MLLEGTLADLPRQAANAEGRVSSVEFVCAHVLVSSLKHTPSVLAVTGTCASIPVADMQDSMVLLV